MGQHVTLRQADHRRHRKYEALASWAIVRQLKTLRVVQTKLVQEAIANCGWSEAAELHQQDASEAFAFITEQLELPRLTLKMDIYHTGKEDAADDHKLVNERLLQVAIPSEPIDGKVITLEECLESYFNNRVEVRRHLEGKGAPNSLNSPDSLKGHAVHIESADTASPVSASSSPLRPSFFPASKPFSLANARVRSSSIIRDRFVDGDADARREGLNGNTEAQQRSRRKSSIRKEVLMPAWQFFSLMRAYAPSTSSDLG